MRELEKSWLSSAQKYRYIHRILSNKKEVEVDLDGTVYLHLKFDYTEDRFQTLKRQLDGHFESTGSLDDKEYYYGGDVEVIGKDTATNTICIQIVSGNQELTDAFLKWNPTPENTMPFIRRFCQVQ